MRTSAEITISTMMIFQPQFRIQRSSPVGPSIPGLLAHLPPEQVARMDHSLPTSIVAEETVGDLIAGALAEIGVTTAYGVISIHNIPIMDAIARQDRIRFIPARGEAGAIRRVIIPCSGL
jgi:hypothetical protein